MLLCSIPILTNDSFRILNMKKSNPSITAFEIAAKTHIPVQHVRQHLNALQQAKLLKQATHKSLQLVK